MMVLVLLSISVVIFASFIGYFIMSCFGKKKDKNELVKEDGEGNTLTHPDNNEASTPKTKKKCFHKKNKTKAKKGPTEKGCKGQPKEEPKEQPKEQPKEEPKGQPKESPKEKPKEPHKEQGVLTTNDKKHLGQKKNNAVSPSKQDNILALLQNKAEPARKRKSTSSIDTTSSDSTTGSKVPAPRISKPPPLQNKGEICYMNSIIQALGSCKKMIEDLETLNKTYKTVKLKQFIELLNALNSSSAQKEFDGFMSSYGWTKEGQQDSFEMLAFFINSIYTELKDQDNERLTNMNKQEFNKYWKEQILPCRVNMNSRTKCSCPSDNKNILNDLALHLPLINEGGKGNINYEINKMINAVLLEDPVDDNCDKCNAGQTLVLSLDGKPPRTLCFHIQANRMDYETGSMIKPDYRLDYPFEIKVQGQRYELVSFVEHLGGVAVGHYLAYRKHDKKWYSLNDTQVDELLNVAKPTEYCKKPYVLFYEATTMTTEL